MAEFKLGRIRFVWKGTWATDTTYLIDDVVSNGGKSYICVANHTASEFFDTDLDNIPTRWNIVADGTSWTGDWTAEQYYNPGAIVKYGALVYICKTGHTAQTYESPTWIGLEPDLNKWEVFATSFNWAGDWDTDTRYRKNDFVVYGGTTYVCKTGHISDSSAAAGLEVDASNWDIFNQGVTFLGDWSELSVRYRVNDLVKYGADLWICTSYHTSSTSFDETKWEIFVNGFQFENSWNSSEVYQQGDTVTYGGYSYIAKRNNTNKQPTTNLNDWEVFTTGFNFVGDWSNSTNYRVGDVIRDGAYVYVAVADSIAQLPTNESYWGLLNTGFRWVDTPETYLDVAATNISSNGADALFDVTRSGTVYSVSVAATHLGTGYAAGDVVKILGSAVGGISPINDITITIETVSAGEIDTITWTGGSVSWSVGTSYVLGDVVSFGPNSYVCIDPHVSTLLDRPDADLTGDFWNLLTAGSEYNIMTETGDIVYYGVNGPTRLPVGTNGQVLRVRDGFPEWSDYGIINNIVYVGPRGIDQLYPLSGSTIDQPWRSVRYAAKQVEEGYLNPNAKYLLTKNKQFIMKEITNWVNYTYTVDITSTSSSTDEFTCKSTSNLNVNMPIEFTGTTFGGVSTGVTYYVRAITSSTTFTIKSSLTGVVFELGDATGNMSATLVYDHAFCERDTGLIVEAIASDISHGGNAKTTTAAKSYYTPAGNAYINSNFGTQIIQTVAAYTYLAELINNVVTNTPAKSYQSLYGVPVTSAVIQLIDDTKPVETGVEATVDSLINIITAGLNAGSVTAILPAVNSNTTISIKTGTYIEVLPIVVPENTALVGDELRSTVVQPAQATALLGNDKSKSISALTHINSLVSDLVQNIEITPTTGNTETQQYINGFVGSTLIATSYTDLIDDAIQPVLAGGLGAVPAFTITDPVGYNTGFFNARRLIVANKSFIVSEISDWINAQILAGTAPFNGFVYNGAKQIACERDVGYIVDALRYDLTYGGNLETTVAARSYYSFGVLVEAGEKLQALAVQERLKSIIDNIAQGDSAGWTKTTSATQDVSGTPGSLEAADFAQDRIQEMYDTINTGDTPATILPSTAWVATELVAVKDVVLRKKAGIQAPAIAYVNTTYPDLVYDQAVCSRDIGYIVEALAYDVMFGSNFRSVKAAMAYYRATASAQLVISDQLAATQAVVDYVGTYISHVVSSQTGSIGSTTAIARVEASANTIYDMMASGLSVEPTLVLPDPTGFDVNYSNARSQIVNNYSFIKAEISQYLNVNYNSVWTTLGATGQASCQRDVGYILDAIRYDLTYGGNTQTLIVGSSYYSNYASTVSSTEITAINAAYARLKTIIGQIAQRQSVTTTVGYSGPAQYLGGTGGNAGSATFAQARVQDVVDWIANQEGNATIAPDITWASDVLQESFAALQAKKSEIQSDVLWWVYKFHQEVNFNAELCSRDTGIIVDALCYDLLTGSNFAAIQVGRSYNRNVASITTVRTNQLQAELGSINFLKYKAKHIAAVGAVAQVDALVADVAGFINGGSVPRLQWTSPSTLDSEYAGGLVLLNDNKSFIQAEVIAYIADAYPSVEYSQAACSRDVGYVIDALHYDLEYGYGLGGTSNTATRTAALAYYSALDSVLQIDPSDRTATINAYTYIKALVQAVVTDAATVSGYASYPYQADVSRVRATTNQVVGSAGMSTSVGTLMDDVIDTITDIVNAPAEVLPGTSWVSSDLLSQHTAVQASKTATVDLITTYITDNFPTLNYNTATCERDVGLIIDAVTYDMMFGTNYRTITAAQSYYRAQAALVLGSQKVATVSSFRELKTLVLAVIGSNQPARRYAKTLLDIVINVVDKGIGSTSEFTGTNTYNNNADTFKAAEILLLNKDFLAAEATAYISDTYKGTVTSSSSVDNRYTTSSSHNLSVGDPVVFTGTVFGGVSTSVTYYILEVPSTTTFTITTSSTSTTEVDLSTTTGTMTATYGYNEDACRRDMGEFIEAFAYDLSYTGNYKSLRAAEVYKNAVEGSTLANMFLVRNSTGVRNMTLNGLNGTLTEINDFGTKRPTAGAFVSLDPGFGPNDRNVWITSRSCYGQNVTMFGTGCTGAKIDGAIHAGGNRSTVHNDFTTIISDGIGVWCTGANSLTELVSVFNYYGYSGYLAEFGGRIRATNGNSSYGTYGVIAEGTDTYEQPIYAEVDNHAQQAIVGEVITDATDKAFRVEFTNAGTNYTNAAFDLSGDGVNINTVGDEFRDRGVFETRLLDLDDGNGYGGSNYGTAVNAAQSGDLVSITIANADVALSTAYPTMRVQLTAGSGVGQYANILTFNQGTKYAQVYKDSFTTLTVTATSTTNNLLTVASTATLYTGMPIYLTGTMTGTGGATGLSANTVYYVNSANFTGTQFQVSTTAGGAGPAVTISNNVTGLTISVLAAGWDHVVPGYTISNALDLTTSYIIEPRINYSAPGYTATATSLSSIGTASSVTYGTGKFVAITASGTATNYSTNGINWVSGGALPVSGSWSNVVYGGGQGATATAVVGGLGGAGAILTATLGTVNSIGAPGADQVISVTIVDGGYNYTTAPTIVFTPVSGGSGAVATCTVLNGKIDTVTIVTNGSGYGAVPTVSAATDRVTEINVQTWGKNYGTATITLTGGGSSNQATGTATITNGGVSSIEIGNDGGSGYTSTPTVTIADDNAKFVAITSNSNNLAYLRATDADTDAWTAGTALAASSWGDLTYGNGVWVAVGGTATGASSTTGSSFTAKTLPTLAVGTYVSVAYGQGTFIAIAGANASAIATAKSANGSTWVAGGNLPSTASWSSIAYGNGRFVAIATSSNKVAYSLDAGATWVAAPAGLPVSQTWSNISYGQGLFIAISTSSAVCATSPDGINWTSRAIASSNWTSIAFGNPGGRPLWNAVSSTASNISSVIETGATAQGRMKAQAGTLLSVRITEPGSGYPASSVTATTDSTSLITVTTTANLVASQPVVFTGLDSVGLVTDKLYYVISGTITSTQFKVSLVAGSSTPVVLTTGTGLSGMYRAGPIVTQYDPNKVVTAALIARTGDGVLANPTFTDRGTGNTAASGSIVGDGYADLYQPSTFIAVRNLYDLPQPGANVEFASLSGTWYKLVAVTNILGNAGNYTATFQISPGLSVLEAPLDGDIITTRLKYSQVRLTGHDFLYIGTGNQADTNYPFVDATTAVQANQERQTGGGRVFFTSTDQDGNFNVGGLFGVQQSTGTATLNADAFNLSGLQSLQLGQLNIGVGSAIITQFSTDPYFTADSDNIVPTQRAIKAYITAQIGGGQSSLNVNTLTSGVVYVANDSISTTSGGQLNITAKMNFTGGIDGAPVALGLFLQR